MPASTDAAGGQGAKPAGRLLAVLAQSRYVASLLVLPVICFLALGWLFLRGGGGTPALAHAHINQAFPASLWGGVLFVQVILLILALGGYESATSWTLVIVDYTTVYTGFALIGILGLAKAMAGKCWRVPLIGPRLPPGCPT